VTLYISIADIKYPIRHFEHLLRKPEELHVELLETRQHFQLFNGLAVLSHSLISLINEAFIFLIFQMTALPKGAKTR